MEHAAEVGVQSTEGACQVAVVDVAWAASSSSTAPRSAFWPVCSTIRWMHSARACSTRDESAVARITSSMSISCCPCASAGHPTSESTVGSWATRHRCSNSRLPSAWLKNGAQMRRTRSMAVSVDGPRKHTRWFTSLRSSGHSATWKSSFWMIRCALSHDPRLPQVFL
eukprot:scaffold66638_cov37-Tisochrysis_lutea.AAC.1